MWKGSLLNIRHNLQSEPFQYYQHPHSPKNLKELLPEGILAHPSLYLSHAALHHGVVLQHLHLICALHHAARGGGGEAVYGAVLLRLGGGEVGLVGPTGADVGGEAPVKQLCSRVHRGFVPCGHNHSEHHALHKSPPTLSPS